MTLQKMPIFCTHRHVNEKRKRLRVFNNNENLFRFPLLVWYTSFIQGSVSLKKEAITISFINPFIAKLMLQQCTETALHELCLLDFISLIQSVWIHLHLYQAILYNLDISCLRDRQTRTFALRELSCHVKGWWYHYHHFGEKMCKRSHSPSQSSKCS